MTRAPSVPSGAAGGRSAAPGSDNSASQPSASRGPRSGTDQGSGKAAFGAEGNRQQVSRIHGLDDDLALSSRPKTIATQLNMVMVGGYRPPTRWIGPTLVLLLSAGLSAGAVLKPKLRRQAIAYAIDAKTRLIAFARHRHAPRPKQHTDLPEAWQAADSLERGSESATATAKADAAPAPFSLRSCPKLAQDATGGGLMDTRSRVNLANCYMVHDDPINAVSTLMPLQARLHTLKSQPGPLAGKDAALDEAYLILISAWLKEGKTREASDLADPACRHWETTAACAGKLMTIPGHHGTGDGDEGLQALFGRPGRMPRTAQAWLWLSGAELAHERGREAAADQRFAAALAAAPKEAYALRKQIYEEQAITLYEQGALLRLKGQTAAALAALHELDPAALTKLHVLADLASPQDQQRRLRSILTREEITFRLRGDMEMIEILGPQALKLGMTEPYMALLQRTRDYYASHYQALDTISRRLSIWEIRTTLAKGDTDQAQARLVEIGRISGDDPLIHHLRGVAYASSNTNARYQVLAASEFQAAYRLKHDWESLYALGATLLRAGKTEQVTPLIHDLTSLITTSGQRYWQEMLSAEWYIGKADYPHAKALLETWRQNEPDRLLPAKLLLQLYQKAGRRAEATAAQATVSELSAKQRPATIAESLASPLGFMALGKRPID